MGLLKKDKLLQRQKLDITRVDLGDGEYVYVRQMTGRERDRFEASILKRVNRGGGKMDFETDTQDFRAKLAACTMCDEKGELLLAFDDYTQLSENMSAARLEQIIEVAQRINRITREDEEELVKHSGADQGDYSGSGSVKS